MKNDCLHRKKTMRLLTKMLRVVISVWGPRDFDFLFIYFVVFSEVAIININYRFPLGKVDVILPAVLTTKLLWLWAWDSTLLCDACLCSSLGSASLAKILEHKHKLHLKEICSGTSREKSQILHLTPQPVVSLEEERCKVLRREGVGLCGEKIEQRQCGGWGLAGGGISLTFPIISHHTPNHDIIL